MKFNLILTLLLLNSSLLNAQDYYQPTYYPYVQEFQGDFILEDDDEPQEHVRFFRGVSNEENLEDDDHPLRSPVGPESLVKGFIQGGSTDDGTVETTPPGVFQGEISAEEESAGSAQEGNEDSGNLNEDPSDTRQCMRKIVEMLKEIKTQLIAELKAKKRSSCKHRNASSLNCICGFFNTPDNPEVPLTYSNISGESKGNHTENLCVQSCISLALRQRSLVYDLICYETNHLNQTTVHLYTSPDREMEDLEWKYSGYAIQTPVCCHRGRKVECSRSEEEGDRLEF